VDLINRACNNGTGLPVNPIADATSRSQEAAMEWT
jgi:hypothetical protein